MSVGTGVCIYCEDTSDAKIVGLECTKGRGLILPGGKFEPKVDETYRHAAIRELKEETGLVVKPEHCHYIWSSLDHSGFYCHAFYANVYTGELQEETEAGKPRWIYTTELVNNSVFWPYYDLLFTVLAEKVQFSKMLFSM